MNVLRGALLGLSICLVSHVFAQEDTKRYDEASVSTKTLIRILDRFAGSREDQILIAGQAINLGGLQIFSKECRYPRSNPNGDAFALIHILDDEPPKTLFEGWMIASSPALNAFDHPRYDVWPLACIIEVADTE